MWEDYGKQIAHSTGPVWFLKLKNRILFRIQKRIMSIFGKLPANSVVAKAFSSFSRDMIGAFIYSIKLEINDQCQLKCKMCYVDHHHQELPAVEIYKLLDSIRNFGIRLEILGGEPFMREDILQIIEYAKAKCHVPFISLYTNGTLVTPQMAKGLKKAGLDAIIVTLVSDTPGNHDEFTGVPCSWEKTVTGIKNLRDAGVNTFTFSAIHADNYLDYKQIYDFVVETLKVHALFYQYIPHCKGDNLCIDNDTWHDIKHWVLYDKNEDHMEYIRNFFMLTGNACSGGNYVLTVKVDGSVQPCPFIDNLPLGNIKQNDIWVIYRDRYKNTGLSDFKVTPDDCQECSYKSVCGGGCKARNDLWFGTYKHADLRCKGPYHEPIDKQEVVDKLPSFF